MCYSHNKTNDTKSIKPFLKQCYHKVFEINAIKNFSLQNNYTGCVLKIGERGNPNYYRVYKNHTQIRFELEQRRSKIKLVQKLIFEDQIENFEQVMTETFFKYSKKVLAIDENYMGWLIDYFKRQNRVKNTLVTGYFNQKTANLKSLTL